MNDKFEFLNNIDDIVDSLRRVFLRQTINNQTEVLYVFKNHTFDCMWFRREFGVYGCAYHEYIHEIRFSADRTCEF